MSRKIVVLAVAATLLLAGCAGLGGNSAGGDGAQMAGDGGNGGSGGDDAGATSGGQENSDASTNGNAQVNAAAQQRAIIRTGRMVVEVDNFSQRRNAIVSQAREYGGYVSDSNQRLHRNGEAKWVSGYVVLRVPSERYRAMQAAVGSEGTVVTEETTTKDVTDQLVDLEARLENLEQRRDRLRTFYDRANDTEELLRIEEELSDVQGEIERLEAQKRSLEQRVAYSTLRVELNEPQPGVTQIRTQYHEQSLAAVFMGSVRDVYVFGRATLVTIAAVAPWLGVLAVPALGLRWLLGGRGVPLVGRLRGGDSETGDSDVDDSEANDTSNETTVIDDNEDR
ncbi:DUF4349 domain-containing protein [Haloarcula nitratireducens]|uniref:DUF4349 domain-containing protein n=1 Tax=Haloarcula nitratireducens TaxID=2487749 RepID=A0AAW4P8P6_9EURY|nr:DUF4349 domain-containing protein [Halomicroarcula nitratireducens]MBX0294249.1 DUF4349 domain-containing protein [Halomicroarcula nitratireducens]